MKTIFTDWKEYNKIEQCAVIVQLICTLVVIINGVLVIANVIDSNHISQIAIFFLFIALGIRQWRKSHISGIFCLVTALLTLAVLIGVNIFRTQHVFLKNTVYKKDVKELFLSYDGIDVDELNKCSELEFLAIWAIDDAFLREMTIFQNLESMYIFNSDIGDEGITKINLFPNLNDTFIMKSYADLSQIQNDSITEMQLSVSEITGITGLANCDSLTYLSVDEVVMDDKIVVTEGTNIWNQKYSLKDSSDFQYLDNIETLKIRCITIEDISGFLEMDSLETLTVSEGYISEENVKTLENHGITVIEETKEE